MHQRNEEKKLEILLNYWAEHNTEHAREFREWAERARNSGRTEVCESMMRAAEQMCKANEFLLGALGQLKEE